MPSLNTMSEGEVDSYLKLVGESTEAILPDGTVYILLLFPDEETSRCISNCGSSPESMRGAARRLLEIADELERRANAKTVHRRPKG